MRDLILDLDRPPVLAGHQFGPDGLNITGGTNGIHQVQPFSLPTSLPLLGPVPHFRMYYWIFVAFLALCIYCMLRWRNSRTGRAWVAIREDETAAAAMGVPLMRTKTLAYAIGAFFGGVAGAFFAEFTTGANPDSFSFNFSVFVLVMVILGGIGNVWGVLVGAAFLAYLDQAGLADTGAWINQHLHVTIDVPKYEFGIYGVILLLTMLFRPNGLIPEARRKLEFEQGVADEPLYDVAHS
jgi:branched-chain amino acid transport system permease protein